MVSYLEYRNAIGLIPMAFRPEMLLNRYCSNYKFTVLPVWVLGTFPQPVYG